MDGIKHLFRECGNKGLQEKVLLLHCRVGIRLTKDTDTCCIKSEKTEV